MVTMDDVEDGAHVEYFFISITTSIVRTGSDPGNDKLPRIEDYSTSILCIVRPTRMDMMTLSVTTSNPYLLVSPSLKYAL